MSFAAFNFTASTDSNLVPFNADLIFGNKKSHMGLSLVSTADISTQRSCALSEMHSHKGYCVVAHGLGGKSMSHSFTFQVAVFLPIHEGLSKPLCNLINSLIFRHPIYMNNPMDVEKNYSVMLSSVWTAWDYSSAWIGTYFRDHIEKANHDSSHVNICL